MRTERARAGRARARLTRKQLTWETYIYFACMLGFRQIYMGARRKGAHQEAVTSQTYHVMSYTFGLGCLRYGRYESAQTTQEWRYTERHGKSNNRVIGE